MARLQLVVRSGARAGQLVAIDRPLVIGRAEGELRLTDDTLVSGRHARIAPLPDGTIVIEDLGSRNGTRRNGTPVLAPTPLQPGDLLELGETLLEVQPVDGVEPDAPAAAPAGGFAELATEHGVVAFRRGTFGASIAEEAAAGLAAASRSLAPLIALTGELRPRVLLVDPFPDPGAPGRMITRGSVLDVKRAEIWLAVSAESPPEPLERPLALLLGSRLPAAAELGPLLEGYGLRAGGAPDPAAALRKVELPAFAQADIDLAAAMARSFAGFLISRAGEQAFLQLLADARPGEVDRAAHAALGHPLAELEQSWRAALRGETAVLPTSRFAKLALAHLRPYRWRAAQLLGLSLLSLTFTVAFPFALESLLNNAIPAGSFGRVAVILALLGGAMLVSLLATWRQTYLVAYVTGKIARDLRLAVFERLQQLELGWFQSRQSGDVLTRLVADVELLQQGLSEAVRQGVVQFLTLIVASITALIINVWLGLVVVVAAPVIGIVFQVMGAGAQRRSLAIQESLSDVSSIATENLSAQPIVKAFGLERRERARLLTASNGLLRSSLRMSAYGGAFRVTIEMISTAVAIGVIALGAWLIIHHHFTVGGLVAFTAILDRVLMPVTALAQVGAQVQTSSGALIRIGEVLDAVPATVDADGAPVAGRLRHGLELRDVSFSYSPERPVLHGVSAEIPAGARVAFVGPSGAGKSSILQLLLRFADPDSGEVLLDGADLKHVTMESVRQQIGVVLQQTFLFDATIRENIQLGNPAAGDAEIEAAARQARLDDTLPEGLDTIVGERGGRLSGGQAQRVAIARALVRDPAILVLDEATSALDPRTERQVSETLRHVGEGRTTVAVTHRLAAVRDYDRIFVIVDGRIVERGTHGELLAAAGVYTEMWEEQTGPVAPIADLSADLARLPLFSELGTDELALVEAELEPLVLRAGERLSEDGTQLVIVRKGTARVLVPGLGAEGRVPVAELHPGQAFGLSALLGETTGAVLEASGPLSLLCIDGDGLERLQLRVPAVTRALRGNQATVVSPVRGRRLGFTGTFARSTIPSAGSR